MTPPIVCAAHLAIHRLLCSQGRFENYWPVNIVNLSIGVVRTLKLFSTNMSKFVPQCNNSGARCGEDPDLLCVEVSALGATAAAASSCAGPLPAKGISPLLCSSGCGWQTPPLAGPETTQEEFLRALLVKTDAYRPRQESLACMENKGACPPEFTQQLFSGFSFLHVLVDMNRLRRGWGPGRVWAFVNFGTQTKGEEIYVWS